MLNFRRLGLISTTVFFLCAPAISFAATTKAVAPIRRIDVEDFVPTKKRLRLGTGC